MTKRIEKLKQRVKEAKEDLLGTIELLEQEEDYNKSIEIMEELEELQQDYFDVMQLLKYNENKEK